MLYLFDIPISVFSIQTKVYTLVCNIVTGIVLGGQPIFGFNYGAGKRKSCAAVSAALSNKKHPPGCFLFGESGETAG